MKALDKAVFRDLDDLIDVAVAEMTEVAPSPEFSARVMMSLNRAPVVHWPRIVSGIAAVAALVLLALWLPSLVDLGSPGIPGTFPDQSQRANYQTTGQTVSKAAPAMSTSRSTARMPEMSAEEAAWLSRAVSPLSASPAIAIDPIQPERTAITPISVQPLAPEPIELTPLVIPSSSAGGR